MTNPARRERLVISFDDEVAAAAVTATPTPAPGPPIAAPPAAFAAPAPAPAAIGLASWGRRFAAAMIDGTILSVGTLAVASIAGVAAGGAAGSDASGVAGLMTFLLVYSLCSLLVGMFYAPILLARSGPRNGQTLGKQALGIRVVREAGGPMTFGNALLRETVMKQLLVGVIGAFLFLIPILLDYLWPLWDDRRQALHDKGASTLVVGAGG